MAVRPHVPPWWAGLADAEASVTCGGAEHRVRWSRGVLELVDHDDPAAERSLAALGGDPPGCVVLFDAWHRHIASPELVTLGRRPGELDLGLPPSSDGELATSSVGFPRRSLPSAAIAAVERSLQRRDDLRRLLSMSGPMIDRLVLTVLASCADRWSDEAFRATHGLRVGAALSVRATPAIRRFGERLGCGPAEISISPARPERASPMVAARLDTGQPVAVSAELPVGWLTNVWGRGISEPDGELVLDVTGGSDDGREFEVVVAEWEPAGPITWEAALVPATVVVGDDGSRRVRRRW